MELTKLRRFSCFQILTKIAYWSLAEIFKFTNFEVCLHSLENCQSHSRLLKSIVNMIYTCFNDEWNRIKKFYPSRNLENLLIFQDCLHSLSKL